MSESLKWMGLSVLTFIAFGITFAHAKRAAPGLVRGEIVANNCGLSKDESYLDLSVEGEIYHVQLDNKTCVDLFSRQERLLCSDHPTGSFEILPARSGTCLLGRFVLDQHTQAVGCN